MEDSKYATIEETCAALQSTDGSSYKSLFDGRGETAADGEKKTLPMLTFVNPVYGDANTRNDGSTDQTFQLRKQEKEQSDVKDPPRMPQTQPIPAGIEDSSRQTRWLYVLLFIAVVVISAGVGGLASYLVIQHSSLYFVKSHSHGASQLPQTASMVATGNSSAFLGQSTKLLGSMTKK